VLELIIALKNALEIRTEIESSRDCKFHTRKNPSDLSQNQPINGPNDIIKNQAPANPANNETT
jgi:hypothetical protein